MRKRCSINANVVAACRSRRHSPSFHSHSDRRLPLAGNVRNNGPVHVLSTDTPLGANHGGNIASSANPLSSPQGLNEVARMLADGTITARISSTVELDGASRMLEKLRHGRLHLSWLSLMASSNASVSQYIVK